MHQSDIILQSQFEFNFHLVQKLVYANSTAHGFWEGEQANIASKIALIHSEVSEALEAQRHGDQPDDKIPQYSGTCAELADTVIRCMDLAEHLKLNLGAAIIAKHNYNTTREKMHGGKKF